MSPDPQCCHHRNSASKCPYVFFPTFFTPFFRSQVFKRPNKPSAALLVTTWRTPKISSVRENSFCLIPHMCLQSLRLPVWNLQQQTSASAASTCQINFHHAQGLRFWCPRLVCHESLREPVFLSSSTSRQWRRDCQGHQACLVSLASDTLPIAKSSASDEQACSTSLWWHEPAFVQCCKNNHHKTNTNTANMCREP